MTQRGDVEKRIEKTLEEEPRIHEKVGPKGAERRRKEEKVIVDLGCGEGGHTASFRKRYPSARIIGIDIDEERIKTARRKYGRDDIEFIARDARYTGMPSDSVDLVIIRGPQPSPEGTGDIDVFRPLLDEAVRIVRLGGRIEVLTEMKYAARYAGELCERSDGKLEIPGGMDWRSSGIHEFTIVKRK